MNEAGEVEPKKSGYHGASPLSPPWTTAVVFLLVVFFAMLMKISLSG